MTDCFAAAQQYTAVVYLLHNLKALGDGLISFAVGVQALHGCGHSSCKPLMLDSPQSY